MKIEKLQRRACAIGNLLGVLAVFAQATLPMMGSDGRPSVRQIFDKQLSDSEREVMGVVEAMPANKFDFAPDIRSSGPPYRVLPQ